MTSISERKRRPTISDPVTMPRPCDLETAISKRKISNEVDAPWDIEKWFERQVKQLAQFYPNPKQTLSLTTTEAIFEHAMEPGERVTSLQNWAEKNHGLMNSVQIPSKTYR
ncbi:hypothetical protein SARC_04881 [Sphaeroforma arctica JP610]|uniref:Uncharacterized protein n=1 Tax=Sphaeroforma arctica JP610 TaxID=667725 RepID=A0A0L0G1W6_9EUKA|nr:hypothetical protein SARC_04881 [Sphaeroforma arctica JP610]KNC82834.1 hypothetical protein SARC_04881 [Sphaeroforma arctica JP610]|eukprot:XP_014156736.1 hypothetical protein SARC_04881 [Sphaeroforma arctica JP610]